REGARRSESSSATSPALPENQKTDPKRERGLDDVPHRNLLVEEVRHRVEFDAAVKALQHIHGDRADDAEVGGDSVSRGGLALTPELFPHPRDADRDADAEREAAEVPDVGAAHLEVELVGAGVEERIVEGAAAHAGAGSERDGAHVEGVAEERTLADARA